MALMIEVRWFCWLLVIVCLLFLAVVWGSAKLAFRRQSRKKRPLKSLEHKLPDKEKTRLVCLGSSANQECFSFGGYCHPNPNLLSQFH